MLLLTFEIARTGASVKPTPNNIFPSNADCKLSTFSRCWVSSLALGFGKPPSPCAAQQPERTDAQQRQRGRLRHGSRSGRVHDR